MRVMRLLPLLLLLLMMVLVFQRLIFTDLILARGDTYHYFYPYWDARSSAFLAGELPLWTNDIFMGIPLLANPQIGTFYPLNWIVTGLRAPDAMRISILLHVLVAAFGMVRLFSHIVKNQRTAAVVAAVVYAFGGTFGAHVEQINQLQGLAFLPWLLLAFEHLLDTPYRLRWGILLAMLWALQIFTGHTQTVFISGVALGIRALTVALDDAESHSKRWQRTLGALLLLALVASATLLLALPQLLPTIELTGMSNRGGGFSAQQATAFSLPPIYLPRALLPGYEGLLFGEYVAYVGVIPLLLALVGMVAGFKRGSPYRKVARIWMLSGVIGVLLAFGRFTPLYWILAELPGFDLFRVPARWMALPAIALSLLAGLGIVVLRMQIIRNRLLFTLPGILLVLIVAARLLPIQQEDIVGVAVPGMLTLGLWMLALLLGMALLLLRSRLWMRYVALLLVSAELFAASRIMPYNDLAPREVYLGQRFTMSQMLAYHAEDHATGRMLAISQLYFDPGDLASLRARYERSGLDAEALHTAFTAIKKQEMLFPNLGLTWHIPTIDGFEGGILPTIYYSQLTSLLLPENSPRTLDGRLGEMLALPECRGACIPDERWLELTGTQFLITDKVYDVWQDGVAYDGAYPLLLDAGDATTLDDLLPDFAGTELRVLFSADVTDASYARLTWTQSDGVTDSADLRLADAGDPLRVDGLLLATVAVPDASALTSLQIDAQLPLQIRALTLVDTRTGDFVQIPMRYPRVLSSDIKIYERNGSERAYLATQTTILPDNWQGHEDALILMRQDTFDPAQHAVLHGDQLPLDSNGGTVALIEESATTLAFAVQANSDSWLIVRDAWYPGWQASIDGEPASVQRANVMFRAVRVPAGESIVQLSFTPTLWYGSIAAGVIAWLAALLLGAAAFWRSRR